MLGGRGGSSGIGGNSLSARISGFGSREYGINMTMRDGAKLSYIVSEIGGTTYVSNGFNDTPEPFPLSGRQMVQRAQKNGATVELVTPAEMAGKRKAYFDYQRTKPDYELGVGLADNRAYRKRARQNRLESRIVRRKH